MVGNDVIHAFTSPGTLEFNELYTSTKIILVAGGGSGAYHRSDGAGAGHYATGGGGAGGVYVETGTTFTPGSYPISIGSGGANQTSDPVSSPNGAGSNGNPSTALGRQAYGGGGGGAADLEIDFLEFVHLIPHLLPFQHHYNHKDILAVMDMMPDLPSKDLLAVVVELDKLAYQESLVELGAMVVMERVLIGFQQIMEHLDHQHL